MVPRPLAIALLVAGLAWSATPWSSPQLALGAGMLVGIVAGNPFPGPTGRASKIMLKACVVGLGFGVPLFTVLQSGTQGVLVTAIGIAGAVAAGLLLGRALHVERATAMLITMGTAVCGGSAIAALGPAIRAKAESMSVALATVFLLNAVALYAFPPIGHALALTQHQFAVWAAIAIHDTGSVVGAAAVYGSEALDEATVLKLVRTLWITPLVVAAVWWNARTGPLASPAAAGRGVRASIPWFIGLFLLATAVRAALPAGGSLFDDVAAVARRGLVVTLFLIGTGLTRSSLRAVGPAPFMLGLALWLLVGAVVLLAVRAFVAG